MKKVLNIGLGGRSFIIDEDAYIRLQAYLDHFRTKLSGGTIQEVMEDLESRISELFLKEIADPAQQTVSLTLVERVAHQLGMPDGAAEPGTDTPPHETAVPKLPKKLYRNPDERVIGGVCSGLSAFIGVDVTVIRVLMVVLFFSATAGFWLYVILWIAAPKAVTPAQKCEMFGLPVTAENMARFTKH